MRTTSQPPPPLTLWQIWLLALFNAVYIVAAAIGVMVTGNGEFVFYLVVLLLLLAIVVYVHFRARFSPTVLWGLSFWGALHMAGGLLPVPESWPIQGDTRVLYSLWLIPGYFKFDHLVHGFGFGVTTLVFWEGLQAITRPYLLPGTSVKTTPGMIVLCCAAALGFGALNEVVEFAATLLVPETNVGGYVNTGWDLVSNTVGVGLVGLWIYWRK